MYFYMKKTTALLFTFALLAAVLCTGVSAASGTYRTLYLGTAEQNNMTFAPFDQENATIDSTAPSNESGDMAFGVGDLYYKAQMNAGYENGMVLTFDQPSESLQDTSAGNGYTAEIAFDYRPDRSHALPVKIRFFPQDKSGNVWTGNRVIHLTFTTGADGATTLELYDRSGSTLLGTANLADALGDYTKDADHFFRIRAVFTPTDAAGSLTRSLKLYVDGTLLFDTAYVNNTKEWRIAGFGIQGKTAYLGDLDNLTMCDYIGEPVASDDTVQINDDRAVAAIRRAAVVLSGAQEGDELAAALRDTLFFAKQSYAQMTSQSDCDNLAKTLENHITEYANATVLKNLVFSDFTDEDSAMITKDLTLPATYVPQRAAHLTVLLYPTNRTFCRLPAM